MINFCSQSETIEPTANGGKLIGMLRSEIFDKMLQIFQQIQFRVAKIIAPQGLQEGLCKVKAASVAYIIPTLLQLDRVHGEKLLILLPTAFILLHLLLLRPALPHQAPSHAIPLILAERKAAL